MVDRGFGPEDVVNRRVNRHLAELLPSRISTEREYHLEGQRFLPSEAVLGTAETCLCFLEAYVGENGRFEVHVERVFDRDTEREWTCENRISRGESGARSPFEYTVRTTVELMGDTHVERSQVEWGELGTEPVHGGTEAQAAVLLAEKMAHLRARENGNGMSHRGSLGGLGSFSSVVDTSRQLGVDWTDVDELLGPGAETIAATTGFDELVSDEKRRRASQKGVDFLTDGLSDELDSYAGSLDSGVDRQQCSTEPWRTTPADMSTTEAQAKLGEIRRRIREMRSELDTESR